jgi:DNA-directed RNA polymerase specialized sigma24 family protein
MPERTAINHQRKSAGPILVTIEDEELGRDCLAGEQTAWVALIANDKRLGYSVPVKCRLPLEDAAHVYRDTCLELLSNLPRLRQPRALRRLLIQVTVHKCLRAKERRPQVGNAGTNETADPRPGSDAALFQTGREQAVGHAISTWSPRCQPLVRLLSIEMPPRPYRQIAEALKVANGSIVFIRGRCLVRYRANLRRGRGCE